MTPERRWFQGRTAKAAVAGLGASLSYAAGFKRIKARPSFKSISDYPPADYDDTGHDGLKSWPRIKELIAA